MGYKYTDESISKYLRNVSTLTLANVVNDLGMPKGTLSSFSRGQLPTSSLLTLYDAFENRLKSYQNELEDICLKITIITIVDSDLRYNDGYSVFGQRKRIEEYLETFNEYNISLITYKYIDIIKDIDFQCLEKELVNQNIAILFSKTLLRNEEFEYIKDLCNKRNIDLCFVREEN